jgi:hypothetical protein
VAFQKDKGKIVFMSLRSAATIKSEGGREGDTFSIYDDHGKRYRFGSAKFDSQAVMCLQAAITEFPEVYKQLKQLSTGQHQPVLTANAAALPEQPAQPAASGQPAQTTETAQTARAQSALNPTAAPAPQPKAHPVASEPQSGAGGSAAQNSTGKPAGGAQGAAVSEVAGGPIFGGKLFKTGDGYPVMHFPYSSDYSATEDSIFLVQFKGDPAFLVHTLIRGKTGGLGYLLIFKNKAVLSTRDQSRPDVEVPLDQLLVKHYKSNAWRGGAETQVNLQAASGKITAVLAGADRATYDFLVQATQNFDGISRTVTTAAGINDLNKYLSQSASFENLVSKDLEQSKADQAAQAAQAQEQAKSKASDRRSWIALAGLVGASVASGQGADAATVLKAGLATAAVASKVTSNNGGQDQTTAALTSLAQAANGQATNPIQQTANEQIAAIHALADAKTPQERAAVQQRLAAQQASKQAAALAQGSGDKFNCVGASGADSGYNNGCQLVPGTPGANSATNGSSGGSTGDSTAGNSSSGTATTDGGSIFSANTSNAGGSSSPAPGPGSSPTPGEIYNPNRHYSGPGAGMVATLLARSPGWSCPSSSAASFTSLPPVEQVCMRDSYVIAAVTEAYGAECEARLGRDKEADADAKAMLENVANAKKMCSHALAIGGAKSSCSTIDLVPCD